MCCSGMPSSLALHSAMVSLGHSLINHYVLHSIVLLLLLLLLLLYYVRTPIDPCSRQLEKKGASPSPPPPPAHGGLGSGAIAAITVVECVDIAGFLGWCVYYFWFCSPAPKARGSFQQVHLSISELINYYYNRALKFKSAQVKWRCLVSSRLGAPPQLSCDVISPAYSNNLLKHVGMQQQHSRYIVLLLGW